MFVAFSSSALNFVIQNVNGNDCLFNCEFNNILTERQDLEITSTLLQNIDPNLPELPFNVPTTSPSPEEVITIISSESELSALVLALAGIAFGMFLIILFLGFWVYKYYRETGLRNDLKEIMSSTRVVSTINYNTHTLPTDEEFTLDGSSITDLERRKSGGSVQTFQTFDGLTNENDVEEFEKKKELIKGSEATQAYSLLSKAFSSSSAVTKHRIKAFVAKIVALMELETVPSLEVTQDTNILQAFDLEHVADIDLEIYLMRLVTGLQKWYGEEEHEFSVGHRGLVLTTIFFNRLKKNVPGFVLTKNNVHQLLAIILLVSVKLLEENVISNSFWEFVSGINSQNLTKLETIFCYKIGLNFSLTETEIKTALIKFEVNEDEVFSQNSEEENL